MEKISSFALTVKGSFFFFLWEKKGFSGFVIYDFFEIESTFFAQDSIQENLEVSVSGCFFSLVSHLSREVAIRKTHY